MSQPTVSVLLPVYNGAKHLRQCIESVLMQHFDDFELLISDDCSTDGTRAVLAEAVDPRLKVFLFDRNAGLFGNLNRLLSRANGRLVRFLCQDDFLSPGCLANEVEFFDLHPEVVMSTCQVSVVDELGAVVGQWSTGGTPLVYERSVGLQMFLYYGCVAGNLSTVCARRSCVESLGGFDESYRMAGDYEMWVRLCTQGRLADLQQPLVNMRQHGARLSLSSGSGVIFVRENRRIRRQLLPLLPKPTQSYAKRYVYLRQNVLDTHELMTCVRLGRLREARELVSILGMGDLVAGLLLWLCTVNNHIYRPKPMFVNES